MTDAAKRKSLIPAAHAAARFACLVVALLLAQTCVWGFGISQQHAPSHFAELAPSSVEGNAAAIGYDVSDCAVAANSGVRLSQKGLNLVENHLGTFEEFAPNTAMMQRLKTAFANGERVTGADANFYLHEANEATTIGRLGYDGAHTGALSKYGVTEFDLYHPQVIQANPGSFNNAWRSYWGIPNP